MKLADILNTIDKNILSEDTATAIASAFESAVNEKVSSRVGLEIEKALKEQDEDHANKLKSLIEQIDNDHSGKLQQVVSAINENHAEKLNQVVSFYRKAINEKAEKFSNKIVEEMSNYLDLYLDKIIPQDQLSEAVANVSAKTQLEQIKKILSLDATKLNDSIKGAIIEGKNTIDSLRVQLNEAQRANQQLVESVTSTKSSLLIEQKTKGMPSSKKEFVSKILSDKSPAYIEENFNYVVQMFEREDRSVVANLAATATQAAVTKDAKVPQLVSESVQKKVSNPYLDVLSSFR
jgi:hypothetical protein